MDNEEKINMPKTVRKLLPDKIYYIGKIESWLSEMALKGLRLKSINTRSAVFEECPPSNTSYCIVELKSNLSNVDINKYKDASWDITCMISTPAFVNYIKTGYKLFIFHSTDSVDVRPTLDVFENRKGIYDKYKTQKTEHIYYIMACLTAFVAAFFNVSEYYILFLPSMLLTISAIFFLFSIMSILDIFKIRNMEITNKKVGTIDDRNWREYYPRYRRRSGFKTLFWVLIIVQMLYIVYAFANILTPGNLDDVDSFVRLEDIEQVDNKSLSRTYGTYTPSLFVPNFYMADEKGIYIDENDETVFANYNITYNRCIFPTVVTIVNGNCVNLILSEGGQVVFTQSERFSKIAYSMYSSGNEYSVDICLSNDKEVIFIRYVGSKTPDELIEAVETTLNNN